MKTRRMLLLTLAFCFACVVAVFADDSNVGTWKLNESKSKIPAGAPKNTIVVYTAAGDSFTGVTDGVDASGKPTHNEWTGKFDGKDYPVVGESNTDTRAIKKVDEHHYQITGKKGGKPIVTGTIVTSTDGNTRTVTIHATSAEGKKVVSTYVYDKQ